MKNTYNHLINCTVISVKWVSKVNIWWRHLTQHWFNQFQQLPIEIDLIYTHIDGLGHKPFKSGQAFFQNDDKNDKTHRAQNVYLSRPTWRGTKRPTQ